MYSLTLRQSDLKKKERHEVKQSANRFIILTSLTSAFYPSLFSIATISSNSCDVAGGVDRSNL